MSGVLIGCREECGDKYRCDRREGGTAAVFGEASCAGDRAPSLSDDDKDEGGVGGSVKLDIPAEPADTLIETLLHPFNDVAIFGNNNFGTPAAPTFCSTASGM